MNSWQDIIQMIYTSEPKNDKKNPMFICEMLIWEFKLFKRYDPVLKIDQY